MRSYDCYVFDLDGTLYRGGTAIEGAAQAIQTLAASGAQILYFSNNSGMTLADYVAKLTNLGFPATQDQLLTSGVAATSMAVENGYRSAFIVGEPGLWQTVCDGGITVVNDMDQMSDVVISGISKSTLSYGLLSQAMQHIRHGADYIACNKDATYPIENGVFQPGSGAVVAFLETCTGVTAKLAGKPNPDILTRKLIQMQLDAKNVLVIGDRLDTDIECGRAAGCDTALVLTGVCQEAIEGVTCLSSVTDLV